MEENISELKGQEKITTLKHQQKKENIVMI